MGSIVIKEKSKSVWASLAREKYRSERGEDGILQTLHGSGEKNSISVNFVAGFVSVCSPSTVLFLILV